MNPRSRPLTRILPKTQKLIQPAQDEAKTQKGIIEQARFISQCMTRDGAKQAVDRIFTHGCTEQCLPLADTLWFRDQLRLTADMRLKSVLTTGASQISKTLGNTLVFVDLLVSGRLSLAWAYASRSSMFNQQPQQFQPIAKHWIESASSSESVQREAISRYVFDIATANFAYANSASEAKTGGASEGKEQASFSAHALWEEERSSWKKDVDLSPRLGASRLPGKNRRSLGTPGSGSGIEREIKEAVHLFCPAVICESCDRLTYLDPKGALLKSQLDPKTNKPRWFNARGEIVNYWSSDGTELGAYVACTHCGSEIDGAAIAQCRLHSKQTGISAEKFLDELPEKEVYTGAIAIYLSPLLRIPNDPYRAVELVKAGLNPENPSIYQQNKLGHQSETDSTGVTVDDLERIKGLTTLYLQDSFRVAGIDQGRDTHWIVILEANLRFEQINILLADAIAHHDILKTLNDFNVELGIIDNEPDRLSAYDLVKAANGKLALADQRSFEGNFKPISVTHGSIEIPAYGINQNLFKDTIAARFSDDIYRVNGKLHRKFEKHVTSVRRDPDSGAWLRPLDHDDDLFFALLFAEAAFPIVQSIRAVRPRARSQPQTGASFSNPFG